MKKLLGSISALILGGTSLSSMPIMEQIQIMNNKNMTQSVQYYWNDDHTEEIKSIFSKDHIAGNTWLKTVYTFELGIKKPTFNTLSFINSKGSKISWGNRSLTWEAPNLKLLFEHENYFQFDSENINEEKFYQFITTTVVDHHAVELNGYNTIDFLTKVGNVWYNKNDVYYMQFLLYLEIDEFPSFGFASNSFSLGDKLELK